MNTNYTEKEIKFTAPGLMILEEGFTFQISNLSQGIITKKAL